VRKNVFPNKDIKWVVAIYLHTLEKMLGYLNPNLGQIWFLWNVQLYNFHFFIFLITFFNPTFGFVHIWPKFGLRHFIFMFNESHNAQEPYARLWPKLVLQSLSNYCRAVWHVWLIEIHFLHTAPLKKMSEIRWFLVYNHLNFSLLLLF